MKLTSRDIKRYAPYHTMPGFEVGYEDYQVGNHKCPYDPGTAEYPACEGGDEWAKPKRGESVFFWFGGGGI